MRRHQDEFDDEIRGHLALDIQERMERGENADDARFAAMRELGNLTLTRESMQAIWRPPWAQPAEALLHDVRLAVRSLGRARGLAATVVATLALGIGANAAVFSVVRHVLLRPLANRDADRLVYIRQSAPGLGAENTTFSVPEIADLRARVTTIEALGEFSTIDFVLVGLGEPRVVQAGVVGGSYFDVMGLRPVLGRLLTAADDGPDAAGAAVLTYRFWKDALNRDAAVIGRRVRLGSRNATIVGVLEPAVPYPADTEIIANIVTSPHHLGATMVTGRTHRMTELFGRLTPGTTIESARAELIAAHARMVRAHPEAYSPAARVELRVSHLRDQITTPARTVLLVLLAAAALVFSIALSNVANLILARSVRRERELMVRAALGASPGALRRTLLAESLVLCGAGAVVGLLLAPALVHLVSRYASRFSVRALDVPVDASLMWVGAGLAIVAAVVLAYVPRLPATHAPRFGLASSGVRITPGTHRRLRVFAVTQIALSFVLLSGAGMLLAVLVTLQTAHTGYDMRRVLVLDVPLPLDAGAQAAEFFGEATRRIANLPGVERVAVGSFAPWRDVTALLPELPFSTEGHILGQGEAEPHARIRNVSPGFFAALGIPVIAGRDFTDEDRPGSELVVVVSQSIARQLFPGGDAVNRRFWWTDPLFGKRRLRRIVGVVADVDDQHVVPGTAMTAYQPLRQAPYGGRVFVRTAADPYALVAPIKEIVRSMSAEQPVERAATLADVRAEVLAPERLTAFVSCAFAGVALLIAVVGVAGVLAFSVSARAREFGVRLALGSTRRQLLAGVLSEGVLIAAIGIAVGAAGGYALGQAGVWYLGTAQAPAVAPAVGAAALLVGAAVVASLTPAARAARVDVVQALQPE